MLGHGHLGGNDWFGVTHDGAAADLFCVPAALCFQVPPGMSLLNAAIVEPFACVLTALRKVGGIDGSDTVHIHGLGAIGLTSLIQARHAGADVTVFDPSPARRDLALRLGAIEAIDPLTAGARRGTGADDLATLVIEASGNPSAQAAALESAGPDGRVLLMGVSAPTAVPARLGLVQGRNLTVTSSTGAPAHIWPAAIRHVARNDLDLSAIVSAVIPLADGLEALARAQDTARNIKVMLAVEATADVAR